MNLEELRVEVDKCNKEIVEALAKRFKITREIGKIKAEENLPSLDTSRERLIIRKIRVLAKNYGLNEDMIEEIFLIIMVEVVEEHNKIKGN